MNTFNTSRLFAGGSGIVIEYHDAIKPVYLFALISIILNKKDYNLPIALIENFSFPSILEWYVNRPYYNPLKYLDYKHIGSDEDLDKLLLTILNDDTSVYKYTPHLNMVKILYGYSIKGMNVPIYFYSEYKEKGIEEDINNNFKELNIKYIYGPPSKICEIEAQNFSYIFSNIQHAEEFIKHHDPQKLSVITIANDFRYNYIKGGKGLNDYRDLYTKINYMQMLNPSEFYMDIAKLYGEVNM